MTPRAEASSNESMEKNEEILEYNITDIGYYRDKVPKTKIKEKKNI